MKCDMCDNEASVFLTQIVEGKMTSANLCGQCSKDKGVTDPTGFQLADFLIGAAGLGKSKVETDVDDALACPACGFTRAHLKKIGRLGCPECYQTFAADLDNMLRAMHKGTRHIGKVPEALRQSRDLSERLKGLQKKLSKAIEAEDFETAAVLRDEIKQTTARSTDTPVA